MYFLYSIPGLSPKRLRKNYVDHNSNEDFDGYYSHNSHDSLNGQNGQDCNNKLFALE